MRVFTWHQTEPHWPQGDIIKLYWTIIEHHLPLKASIDQSITAQGAKESHWFWIFTPRKSKTNSERPAAGAVEQRGDNRSF